MDPTQNQSGTPGPIFSAGPGPEEPPMTPAPSGSGNIVFQPNNDYYSAAGGNTRSKKPLIIGVIAVVAIIVILLIVLPILSNGGEKPVDESKVKPAVYSYINYLVYGEESDSYKDISDVLSEDYTFLPTGASTLYANSMMHEKDKNLQYFITLDEKLDNLIMAYEEAYSTGMEFEAIKTFYSEFAAVANNPETDAIMSYAKGGVSSLDTISDITTDSTNEDIIKYVEASNKMRKIYVDGMKSAYEDGCYINYNSDSDTVTESIEGCFSKIQFNDFGPYSENYSSRMQIEQTLRHNAADELNNLFDKFYKGKE